MSHESRLIIGILVKWECPQFLLLLKEMASPKHCSDSLIMVAWNGKQTATDKRYDPVPVNDRKLAGSDPKETLIQRLYVWFQSHRRIIDLSKGYWNEDLARGSGEDGRKVITALLQAFPVDMGCGNNQGWSYRECSRCTASGLWSPRLHLY